jgi:hypothetical protein
MNPLGTGGCARPEEPPLRGSSWCH